jgi:hypothetical protein
MRSHHATSSLRVNPDWDKMIRDIYNPLVHDSGHFVLSLGKFPCMTEQSSLSRYNVAHIEGVLTLILANHLYAGYHGTGQLQN